jgi:nicotinamidase-related amidase
MSAIDRTDPARCTLVLVDYQARLLPAIERGAQVLADACRVADTARLLEVPVIGTEQHPAGLGPNVDALRQRCASTLTKMHFDACDDGLLDTLAAWPERQEVVIAGCESHVCLMQTALGLRRAGRTVRVVADACGSRRGSDHALAMQRLHAAGAVVVGTEMLLFEWLADCRHPAFRPVLDWVKQR